MTRFANSNIETALDDEHVLYTIACELDFSSGVVRAHLGGGELIINGNTYYGVGVAGSGGFGALSEVIERPDARDYSELRLSISGVSSDLIDKVPDRSEYRNRYGAVYLIPIDKETMLPITPIEGPVFEGFMDQLTRERKQGTASIQVTLKHYDSLFAQASGLLYTDAHQKGLGFDTDTYFSKVESIQNKEAYWGGRPVYTGARPDGPRLPSGRPL